MSESPTTTRPQFLATKEYRRFAELCDACRRYRYIGVCTGAPGVGKTLSARHYAQWELVETWFQCQRRTLDPPPAPPALADCRCIVYTPSVTVTPRRLDADLHELGVALKLAVDAALYPDRERYMSLDRLPDRAELVLVDEADRLKLLAIEQLRDHYDRDGFGLVLIGMPGLEKRLARYPQLYSRVGFVHQYRALSTEELAFILTHTWAELGLTFAPNDFTDAEALAAVVRITSGNFRLVQRLCTQIERIVEINQLRSISKEVVEAARESLVIGPAG